MSGFFKNKSRKSFHEFFSRSKSASMDFLKAVTETGPHESSTNSNSNDAIINNESQSAEPPNGIDAKAARNRKHFARSRKLESKSDSKIVIKPETIGHISINNYKTDEKSNEITQYDLTQFIRDEYTPTPSSDASVVKSSGAATKLSSKRDFVLYLNAKDASHFSSLHATVARSLIRKGAKPIVFWKFPAYRVKFLAPMSDALKMSSIGWHRSPGAILEVEHIEEIKRLALWVDGEEFDYNPASDVDMSLDNDVDENFEFMWDFHGYDISAIIGTEDFN